MPTIKDELIALSDYACERLASRIADMGDDEYLWEPAPDCWSIRPGTDGKLRMQWGLVFDEVAPLTTIAWRMTHIIDLLSEERCATWIGLEPEPENLLADGAPASALASRDLLQESNARWRRYVTATEDAELFENMGPVARGWADHTRVSFILHIIDELIHHAAEVALMRDLYTAQHAHDPVVSKLLGGDRAATAQLGDEAVGAARAEHPDLVRLAAATARWDAIPHLIELGFEAGNEGRTALHHAAADGRVQLMRLLIDNGADVSARDPVYEATPRQWAEFFNRTEAVDLLRSLDG